VEKRRTKKYFKTYMLRSIGNSPEQFRESMEPVQKKKRKAMVERICRIGKF